MKSLCITCAFLSCFQVILFGQTRICGADLPFNRSYLSGIYIQDHERTSDKVKTAFAIPITPHIVRKSDGAGGLTKMEVIEAIQLLNDQFAPIDLSFYIDEWRFVDDDLVYDYEQYTNEAAFIRNSVDRTINVYMTNSLSVNGKPYGGYAYYPGGPDLIVLTNDHLTNGSTLAHEMGHFYSLIHTHGPSNIYRTSELADGSNCANSGDKICDTAADPQLDSTLVNDNCEYVGDVLDANGVVFRPDPNNIMSYSRSECKNAFTLGQYNRMRAAFDERRLNIIGLEFAALFTASATEIQVGEEVQFVNWSIGSTDYQWEFEGGYPERDTIAEPTVTYHHPGEYTVSLTLISPTGEISVKEVQKHIIVTEERILNVTRPQPTIKVFPNPVQNYLHLDIPAQLEWNSVQIIDLSGRSLYNGPSQSELDVSQLSRGVYLIRIAHQGDFIQQPFIKE